MRRDTSVSRQPRPLVPLPAFACFLERTRFLQAAASAEDAVKTPRAATGSSTDWAVSHIAVGATWSSAAPSPPTVSPLTNSHKLKQLGVGMCSPAFAIEAALAHSHQNGTPHSTRRSLLRLAPAQVRTGDDGCPLLRPVIHSQQPTIATKRCLKDHQRCEIVLRVRSGERQAHLAKEFGISRAAVSYLLRHQSQVLSKFTKKHSKLQRQPAT